MYDPKRYWESRENPNAVDGGSAPRFIMEFLRRGVKGKTPVLEVGPGIGRTFGVYSPEQTIQTIDLSTRYCYQLHEKALSLGLTVNQSHIEKPDATFPYGDNVFEVGVCSQVLLHIPPQYLLNTMGEIVRTCQTALIVTRIGEAHAEHVFDHDYGAACAALGISMNSYEELGNTALFQLQKPAPWRKG